MTEEKKKQKEKDLVNEGREERQETLDKLSIDSSEAHTYDKNSEDEDKNCS